MRSLVWLYEITCAMSRSTDLPPRCPLNIKPLYSSRSLDSTLSLQIKEFYGSPSQSSILEERPSWIDDLLNDSDSDLKGVSLRRAVSDTAVLLESTIPCSLPSIVTEEDCSCDGHEELSLKTNKGVEETGGIGELEASCVYGPNSPRIKNNLTASESSIVTALAEYVPQSQLLCMSKDPCFGLDIGQSDPRTDSVEALGNCCPETKAAKRHPGQRSRVRKLRYIAELERTVNFLVTLESELAGRIASLCQQRIILSVENSTLKKQIASLHTEKLIKDGQYQSLKKEAALLKRAIVQHQRQSPYIFADPSRTTSFEPSWQMLDMGKLSLGGSAVSLKHGFTR